MSSIIPMQVRLDIYKRSYQLYKKDRNMGICWYLKWFTPYYYNEYIKYYDHNSIRIHFPEIWNQRPENAGAWWWPQYDVASRIYAFKQAIKELKLKIKERKNNGI